MVSGVGEVQTVTEFRDIPIAPGIQMTFAFIPPGWFLMGASETEVGQPQDERQRSATVTQGFFLGVYPVTQGQWQALTGTNPSRFSRQGEKASSLNLITDDELAHFPVETISWHDAQAFCQKLSERTGKSMRLPNVMEWEYACRARTTRVRESCTAPVGFKRHARECV